jgi:hypothetical protein
MFVVQADKLEATAKETPTKERVSSWELERARFCNNLLQKVATRRLIRRL